MAVYFIQGSLGAGKTLTAVSRMQEYLKRGRPVATNVNLYPRHLMGVDHKTCNIIRLPDEPNRDDFLALGTGRPPGSRDESENGLIVLDECMIWFNAREYRNPERQGVIKWMVNARKLGWDIYILIQSVDDIDAQARRAFMEHYVTCRRLDRMQIPFIGALYRYLTGSPMPMPRLHMGKVVYTVEEQTVDQWYVRGEHLFKGYDTSQTFLGRETCEPHEKTVEWQESIVTSYSLLTPWITHGRYKRIQRGQKSYRRYLRMMIHKVKLFLAFGSGMIAASIIAAGAMVANADTKEPEPIEIKPASIIPEYGRLSIVSEFKFIASPGEKNTHQGYAMMTMETDTGITVTDRELLGKGYKKRKFSDCYYEFTSPDQVHTIPAVCYRPPPEEQTTI